IWIVLERQPGAQGGELRSVEDVVELQLQPRLRLLTERGNREATLDSQVPVPESRVAEDSERHVAEVADSGAERLRHRERARVEVELILFGQVGITRDVEDRLTRVDAGGRRARRQRRVRVGNARIVG